MRVRVCVPIGKSDRAPLLTTADRTEGLKGRIEAGTSSPVTPLEACLLASDGGAGGRGRADAVRLGLARAFDVPTSSVLAWCSAHGALDAPHARADAARVSAASQC